MFLQNSIGSERLEKLRVFLLTLFALSLPLHQKWSTLILLALVGVSLFLKKEKTIFWHSSFFLPPLLYLIIAISLLYSEQMEFRYLEQRASMIAFPIIFSAARLNQKEFLKVLKYFIWGCGLAAVFCNGYAIYNSIVMVNGEVIFKPVINEEFSFMYSVVRDGNYFFSSYFSIFHQSTYFAIYLNVAIAAVLAFSLWRKHKIYLFILVFFPLVIFQLSSKISLLICGLIFMIYGLSRIQNKLYKGLFVAAIFSILTLLILKNPRSKIMVDTLFEKGFTIDPTERYGYSLRLMSWDAAITVIGKNPIFGAGVADTQKELNTVYEEKGYAQPLKESLNAHNQFLQISLVAGLVGLIIFIAILWSLYQAYYKSVDNRLKQFEFLLIIVIFLSFLFESILNRYSGISFFLFLYYLVITVNKKIINGN